MSSRTAASELIECPACGGQRLKSFGPPRVIDSEIVKSRPTAVCRCSRCDLLFFVPVHPSVVLLDQYSGLAGDLWTGDFRPDWTLARRAIVDRMATGSILDVGCWTGGFLAALPSQYDKWGVEPSGWARDRATDKGIALVGNSLEDLVASNAAYDVVAMIDVIEHIASPLEALSLALGRLKDGGILVITTGDSRALPWRLMPRDYWYYFTEHVCFFSQRWFRWAAARLDLEIEEVTRFSHYPPKRRGTPLSELARACASRLLGGPQALPVRLARRVHLLRGRSETYHWRDHMLVVLRKR
ncbi:MAG: hypothetical protein A2133_02100 [Actinobacteria bacterium RBG_16_64_13]|nr:MAG: hypothetical protein A2133_02100 [Actinobacteria bacterium RBG_16_64_13]